MSKRLTVVASPVLFGLFLSGFCGGAIAQSQPAQNPPAQNPPAQNDSVHRYVDAQGNEVTVHSGQPAPDNYGPRPTFAALDRNHDGFISREEAEAYPPLASDFDYLTHGERISAAQYARWNHR
jgi:hypothetical protein